MLYSEPKVSPYNIREAAKSTERSRLYNRERLTQGARIGSYPGSRQRHHRRGAWEPAAHYQPMSGAIGRRRGCLGGAKTQTDSHSAPARPSVTKPRPTGTAKHAARTPARPGVERPRPTYTRRHAIGRTRLSPPAPVQLKTTGPIRERDTTSEEAGARTWT